MNVRPETIKLLEGNIDDNVLNIGFSNNALNLTPKTKAAKKKNKQMGLYKTKNLLHSKGNHEQNEKEKYLWIIYPIRG